MAGDIGDTFERMCRHQGLAAGATGSPRGHPVDAHRVRAATKGEFLLIKWHHITRKRREVLVLIVSL